MTRGIRADFGLAWRNIWRNKTRTAVTGMAIALSLALQFFSYGTADYSYEKMEQAAVKTAGGSVLVHARGYWKAQTARQTVQSPDPVIAVVNKIPHVQGTVSKVIVTGLSDGERDGNVTYTLDAKAKPGGGYSGNESASVSITNQDHNTSNLYLLLDTSTSMLHSGGQDHRKFQ